MATLRALRATDMRDPIADGILIAADQTTIVLSDGVQTTELTGIFRAPFSGPVSSTGFTPTLDTGAVFGIGLSTGTGFSAGFSTSTRSPATATDLFEAIPSFGTVTGLRQFEDGRQTYTVKGFDADASLALRTIRADDTDFLQRLLYAGDDIMFGSNERDWLFGYDGRDVISGNDGGDRIRGQNGNDSLYGGDGKDRLSGGADIDRIFGGRDDDRLKGGKDNDWLWGEGGNDRLDGGPGRDVLEGDGGEDVFRFIKASHTGTGSDRRDIIKDFDSNRDQIDLRRIDADVTEPGRQTLVFIGNTEFDGQAGELRFDRSRDILEGDTDGNGKADFQIRVHGDNVDAGDLLL